MKGSRHLLGTHSPRWGLHFWETRIEADGKKGASFFWRKM